MTLRLLTTSMGILLLMFAFSFPAAAKNWNQDEVEIYDGWHVPHEKEPNYPTSKFYLYRYLNDHRGFGKLEVLPSNNPRKIIGVKSKSSVIQQEMTKTSLLSYMYYEEGGLLVDEITPRFDGRVRNDTLLYSFSHGKSLAAYLLGHSICDGLIPDVDHRLNDWDLLKGTLYENQKLIDLINMVAGDYKHVHNRLGMLKTGRHYNTHSIKDFASDELKDTRPAPKKYDYNGMPPNIVLNYIAYKTNGNFQKFFDKVMRSHVGIEHKFIQMKNGSNKTIQSDDVGPYRATFHATRYDFLRLAITILDDWKSDNCVGQFLKTIYQKRIPKNEKLGGNWVGAEGSFRGYGGFFHTDQMSLKDKTIMSMSGYGGQMLWIDFDNSRILSIHTVHHGYDWQKIGVRAIRGEEDIYTLLGVSVLNNEPVVIAGNQTKYDRTVAGMKVRFKCLADYAVANDISGLPTEQEINSLTSNLKGNDYYRSKRQIVKAGISKAAMDANKAALVRLVNFEGTNDEYCAKISAYGENLNVSKYALNVSKYASQLKEAGMGDYISNPDSVIRSVGKTKYDRTTRGMIKRFDCLREYTTAKGLANFPMPEEIDRFIRNIQGNYYYRPHTVFAELGLSKKSVAAHQHALERLVNYLGTNDAFCAKPAL